jgi:hypothetical protein
MWRNEPHPLTEAWQEQNSKSQGDGMRKQGPSSQNVLDGGNSNHDPRKRQPINEAHKKETTISKISKNLCPTPD